MNVVPDANHEIRDRILAPIDVRDADGSVIGANLGALVRRLVLFEQVAIDSAAMRELPALINAIGTGPFRELLDSGAVLIRADGWASAESGNADREAGWEALPPLTYRVMVLVPHDREAHIHLCLSEIRDMEMPVKTSQRVRNSIVDSLLDFPRIAPLEGLESLPRDLTRDLNLVYAATAKALTKKLGRNVADTEFEVRFEQVESDVFAAETNIGTVFGLSEEETDGVVQDALLAICGLNQRLAEMKGYESVIGFRDGEIELAQEKLSFLLNQVDPNAQEDRFNRVITLGDLPDPETTEGSVDIGRLLEIRNSDDIREFRQWLRTLDNATDDEIRERLDSVRAKLAPAVYGTGGKTTRFVAGVGLGMIPIVGPIAGLAAGAVDQFLLDKIIPEPGPVSFIGSTYRSIFERSTL
jgi:hypothetical protein